MYDIIVVGAGPAGLTAGANAANRGLKTLILEGQGIAGGQPATFYPKKIIIDHPGFPKGVSGRVLARRLYEQALHSKAEIRLNEPMEELKIKGRTKHIKTRKSTYEGRRVILATGLHNIPKHHPALKDYRGRNVHHFVKDPKKFKGNVLVIGGGDTAFDRAKMVCEYAEVTLIVREAMAKAKHNTVNEVKQKARVMYGTDLAGYAQGTAILKKNGRTIRIKADSIIVSIGFASSLDVLHKAGLRKTHHGTIWANERMETSLPGVFAAGDLASDVKLIATACAQGIIAAVSTFESIKKPYWLNK